MYRQTMAASTISVFGDKRQYKDGSPGLPAFDLLRWIPDPFVGLFEKEAVVNIYFNTDIDGIITDPKTGSISGLKNRGCGKNASLIPGCVPPHVEGYYQYHKYLTLRTDEKTDPKHPKMSCFDIKNIPTGTEPGQNCIIFIAFRNQASDEKQRVLFTNDQMTRGVWTKKKSDKVSELVIQCGIRSHTTTYNTKQWQILKVQYTCTEDVTECNYTLYNHGSKDNVGTITAPSDLKDTSVNLFIAGFGPKKPQNVAGQLDISSIQVYMFFNNNILPTQMTSLIIQKLHTRTEQHHTSKNSSSMKTSSRE